MAAPVSKSPLFSAFRSSSSSSLPHISRRNYHVELAAREKALLEEDPALKKFRSYKKGVKLTSKIGTVLTGVAVAACSYQLVVKAMT
ncbi:succinate dehydrogenase subunit [Rhynchospora pubera]|uniref:Succinate dehydrogenase subunit n=1 Tax=Rhynchospora pubera TaxID=906938 RepID=A0AAV8GLE7_9POAL|nr:succinate dehydrogenase subunit [Rhynchospora pubera]